MKKIQFISQFFYWLFLIILVALPVLSIVFWVNAPALIHLADPSLGFTISEIPKGVQVLHLLSVRTKICGFAVNLVPLAFNMLVVFFLVKLFTLFKKGELFTIKNVACIKRVGVFLFLRQLVNPFYQAAVSAIVTYGNPVGHRYAIASLSGTNIGLFLTAILIILISWIMAEGCKLQEEQKLTV